MIAVFSQLKTLQKDFSTRLWKKISISIIGIFGIVLLWLFWRTDGARQSSIGKDWRDITWSDMGGNNDTVTLNNIKNYRNHIEGYNYTRKGKKKISRSYIGLKRSNIFDSKLFWLKIDFWKMKFSPSGSSLSFWKWDIYGGCGSKSMFWLSRKYSISRVPYVDYESAYAQFSNWSDGYGVKVVEAGNIDGKRYIVWESYNEYTPCDRADFGVYLMWKIYNYSFRASSSDGYFGPSDIISVFKEVIGSTTLY